MALLGTSLSGREIIVAFLSILFGIGSWIAVKGLWVELPLLVRNLPEGWNLASYLFIIVQCGNIGPLLYVIIRKFCPAKYLEHAVMHLMMAVGFFSCLLLIFLWDKTTFIGGNEHSTSFISLSFFASLVDSTSSVLFLPFMAHLKEKYLNAYLIGESLSELLPSAVALGQGVNKLECTNMSLQNDSFSENTINYDSESYVNLQFSVNYFFTLLVVFMTLSWIAFILLSYLPQSRKEQVCSLYQNPVTAEVFIINSVERIGCCGISNYDPLISNDSERQPCLYYADQVTNSPVKDGDYRPKKKKTLEKCLRFLTPNKYIYLLSLQAWLCLMSNGVFPAVQPYSCLAYGSTIYRVSMTLSSIIKPAVCFTAIFIVVRSCRVVSLVTVLATSVSIYPLAIALFYHLPPLHETFVGQALVVTSWVLMEGFFWFAKVSIANILRKEGKHALFWYGLVTQISSSLGAILIYIVIKFGGLFHGHLYCISS